MCMIVITSYDTNFSDKHFIKTKCMNMETPNNNTCLLCISHFNTNNEHCHYTALEESLILLMQSIISQSQSF